MLHVTGYRDDWRVWLTATGTEGVDLEHGLTFDLAVTTLQAAIDGLGVAIGRTALVAADLAAGRLVAPFDVVLPAESAYYVVAPKTTWNQPKVARFRDWLLQAVLAAALAAPPAGAWTERTQLAIIETAAKLAPDDLARQLERHKAALRRGVTEPFADHSGSRHEANLDGSGRLREVVRAEAQRTVAGIEGHRPFSEIVHQIGVVSHFVADLNDPLRVANLDPRETAYGGHYPRYLDGARGRFTVIFYGSGRTSSNFCYSTDSLRL